MSDDMQYTQVQGNSPPEPAATRPQGERRSARHRKVPADDKRFIWGIAAVLVITALVIVVAGLSSRLGSGSDANITEQLFETEVAFASNEATEPATVQPATEEQRGVGVETDGWSGVLALEADSNTWTRWQNQNKVMAMKHRGFVIPMGAIEEHVLEEATTGEVSRYVYRTSVDMPGWLNTNWDRLTPKIFVDGFYEGDEFLVMELDILAEHGVDTSEIDERALVFHNNEWCVILARRTCTNMVWPTKGARKAPEPEDEPEDDPEDACERPEGEGLPGTPTNSVYVNLPAVTPAPSEPPVGNAEAVEENRGTGADRTGERGTGEGGETANGEDLDTGEEAPEPTTDPDPELENDHTEGEVSDEGIDW